MTRPAPNVFGSSDNALWWAGTVIPGDVPRTPRWRGITAVQEFAAAGVAVAAASDNVRDHWHRYGDYDLLEVFGWVRPSQHSFALSKVSSQRG